MFSVLDSGTSVACSSLLLPLLELAVPCLSTRFTSVNVCVCLYVCVSVSVCVCVCVCVVIALVSLY